MAGLWCDYEDEARDDHGDRHNYDNLRKEEESEAIGGGAVAPAAAKKKGKRYCVTGATGFIGSWLLKSLLQTHTHITLHAVTRNPDKACWLKEFDKEEEGRRVRIFKGDLLEYGSFDEAIQGCDGVFHVAASMEFGKKPGDDNYDYQEFDYMKEKVIKIAKQGTLNVLDACNKAKSVKRVVFTSSISTISGRDKQGNLKEVVDESCTNPLDTVFLEKPYGWVYIASKVVAEETAFWYAKANNMDVVSLVLATVGGPFLTPCVPASLQVLLSPISGDRDMLTILANVFSRLGTLSLVHIQDACNAHILLMEEERANGRYICSAVGCTLNQLAAILYKQIPSSKSKISGIVADDRNANETSRISSERLKELGFEYKHDVEEIVKESIDYCLKCEFL